MALILNGVVTSELVTTADIFLADLTGAYSPSSIVDGIETGNPYGYGTADTRYSSTNRNQLALFLFAYHKSQTSIDDMVTVTANNSATVIDFNVNDEGDFLYKFILIALPIVDALAGNYDLVTAHKFAYDTVELKVVKMLTSTDMGGGVYSYTFEDVLILSDILEGDYATDVIYYPRNINLYIQKALIFFKYESALEKDIIELKKLFDQFKLQVLGIEIAVAKQDWLRAAKCFDAAKALLNCHAFKCFCQ